MADTLYLEKMGRELKCPICLSLLDSAASLTCNHVFCNSCIQKSMKSGSNCPVCKVPYQRREIRPAPHMDNLVNIYKSMEVASGVTLHVSQKEPTAKWADAKMQATDDLDATMNNGENADRGKCQVMEGTSSITSKLKPKRSGRNRGKSSFATNKRVQVPQSPNSETPLRQKKDRLSQNKEIEDLSSTHRLSTQKEGPNLSPFFWLREVERTSQQTDVEQLTLSCTPEKVPSFSDLKDSDDEVPPEISVEEQTLNKGNADLLDSEMFEWTQRECSPELCSSPIQKQVEEKDCDTMLGKKMEAVSRGAVASSQMITLQQINAIPQENNSIMDNELHNNAFSTRKGEDRRIGGKVPSKRVGKKIKGSKKNCRKNKQVEKAFDNPKISVDLMQCNESNTAIGFGRSKAVGISITGCDDYVIPDSPVALRSKRGTQTNKKLEKLKRKSNSTEHSNEDQSAKRKERLKNMVQPVVNAEKSCQSNEVFLEKSCRAGKRSKNKKTNHKHKENCQLVSVFKQKFCVDEISRGDIADGGETVAQAAPDSVQAKSNDDSSRQTLKKGKVHCNKDLPSLRKCDKISIKCAFCHLTADTEATGEMAHYSEGRPVAANHNRGSVIHSHKYCTEWAPNVYFEDDMAVNLEEELTRSRRIKCSLCGVKGAALGCYEKSCRKSFHVPCAKMLRGCRWDTDHFVILCPLHASSKLPSELSTPVRKRKCNTERKVSCQKPQVAVRDATTRLNKWNCGRESDKIVFCCSALTAIEKEAVSELAKSSGAVLLGRWNPSVTHVIASTNENEACKRTLKVMMGILEGKWILSIKWVQACKEATRLIEETPYEITCDIHGVQNGPRLGRLRLLTEQPKLFAGFNFYFMGDFEPSYKGYLQDLVTVGGGTVLHRKPIAQTHGVGEPPSSARSTTVIIYSIELPANCDTHEKDVVIEHRHSDAEALAISSGAKLANNSWVLNCIAGHKLQDL